MLTLEKHILEKALASLSHDSQIVPRGKVIRDTMILRNYGLVVKVALRHQRDDIPFDDLKGYGTEGLIRAVDGFDPKKGFKFSSYAGRCISQTITRSVIGKETPIRLPENRAIEKKRKGREEIKVHVKGVKPPQSSKKEERIDPEVVYSLDDCNKESDGGKSPENFVLQKLREESRVRAVGILEKALLKDEWFVLRGRFCFDTEKPMTLRKMGAALSISPESVRNKMSLSLEKARRLLLRNRFTSENFF